MKLLSIIALSLLTVALQAQTPLAKPVAPAAVNSAPKPGSPIDSKIQATLLEQKLLRDEQLKALYFANKQSDFEKQILALPKYKELSLQADQYQAAAEQSNKEVQKRVADLNKRAGCQIDLDSFDKCAGGPPVPVQ